MGLHAVRRLSLGQFLRGKGVQHQQIADALLEKDAQAALDTYREILTRVCSRESYDALKNAGFPVIFRDENRSREETVLLAEGIFGI